VRKTERRKEKKKEKKERKKGHRVRKTERRATLHIGKSKATENPGANATTYREGEIKKENEKKEKNV
jgi:hypothetical protein